MQALHLLPSSSLQLLGLGQPFIVMILSLLSRQILQCQIYAAGFSLATLVLQV